MLFILEKGFWAEQRSLEMLACTLGSIMVSQLLGGKGSQIIKKKKGKKNDIPGIACY